MTKYLLDRTRMVSLLSLLFGVTFFLLPGFAFSQFLGAESCIGSGCHEQSKLDDWRTSGHRFILMSKDEAKHRAIPLPGGYTWDDISYVVGGRKWMARYLDSNGYFITTTQSDSGASRPGFNQYNVKTGEWSDYRAGEANVPYDCGSCHTTSWVANENPADTSGNQGGLPGIHGTFDATGVECEQCHGLGFTMDGDTPKEAAFCGSCHSDGDNSTIAANDGFINYRQQYDELLAGPHAKMDCVSCHSPHKTAEFGIEKDCASCHPVQATAYADNVMADYDVKCEDCHMPHASLVAQKLGPFQGDSSTHIFYINTDPAASMFTESGDFVALDNENKAAISLEFACKRCHQNAEVTELARFAKNFHGTERDDQNNTLSPLEYVGINPGLTGHWWGGQSRDGEGMLVDVAYTETGALIMIVSFYTYDNMGNQVWLIGFGVVEEGNNTVTVNLTIPSGAKWGAEFNPDDLPEPRTPWGTGQFMFDSCGGGSVLFTPNADQLAAGFTEYGYDINRSLTVPGISCPIMQNNPN